MDLSQQVVSLDLAKRLKELGVKQESYFYWCFVQTTEHGDPKWKIADFAGTQSYSAFTVAELGQMLFDASGGRGYSSWLKTPTCAVCVNVNDTKDLFSGETIRFPHHEIATTEADARAQMLIHLIDKKLATT